MIGVCLLFDLPGIRRLAIWSQGLLVAVVIVVEFPERTGSQAFEDRWVGILGGVKTNGFDVRARRLVVDNQHAVVLCTMTQEMSKNSSIDWGTVFGMEPVDTLTIGGVEQEDQVELISYLGDNLTVILCQNKDTHLEMATIGSQIGQNGRSHELFVGGDVVKHQCQLALRWERGTTFLCRSDMGILNGFDSFQLCQVRVVHKQ